MRRLALTVGVLALLAASGCATQVWGGVYADDAGDDGSTITPPPPDGGPLPFDGPPVIYDMRPPPFDEGPLDIGFPPPADIGFPPPVDIGPPPVDIGPPPVDFGPPPVDFGGPVDLSIVDASHPVDLTVKTCGDIIRCVISSGGGNFGTCFAGAPPDAVQEAGSLLMCAAANCLNGSDGGMGSQFQCVLTVCNAEVQACKGLF